MQVISYPSFAEAAATRRAKLGVLLCAVSLGAWSGSRIVEQVSLYLLLLALLTLSQGVHALISAFNAWKGAKGERDLVKELSELDDRHLLVRNWVPDESAKSGDVDLVLLGPFGALVIEAKCYSAPVKCEKDSWFIKRQNGSWRKIKSVSKQLNTNIKQVSAALDLQVQGAIVFNNRADLKLTSPTVKVLRRKNLLEWVAAQEEIGSSASQLWERRHAA